MSRSNAKILALLSCVWFLVYGSACSPCHTGHTEVTYREAYTSTTSVCVSQGKYGCTMSVPITTHHPPACWSRWVCDLKCKALDKGKAEAHPKHKPLNLYGDKVDKRCYWENGSHAVPR